MQALLPPVHQSTSPADRTINHQPHITCSLPSDRRRLPPLVSPLANTSHRQPPLVDFDRRRSANTTYRLRRTTEFRLLRFHLSQWTGGCVVGGEHQSIRGGWWLVSSWWSLALLFCFPLVCWQSSKVTKLCLYKAVKQKE